jgi:GNAT superfamily N-acetyltransferase
MEIQANDSAPDFSSMSDTALCDWVRTHCVECGEATKTSVDTECSLVTSDIAWRKWRYGFAALRLGDRLSPLELLWVYVDPRARGHRLGRNIVRAIASEFCDRVIVASCAMRYRPMFGAAGFLVERRLKDWRSMIRLPNGVGQDDREKPNGRLAS